MANVPHKVSSDLNSTINKQNLKNKYNMGKLIKLPQLFILCLVMLSFMSCTVQSYEWEWGEEICKDHKGLREIKADVGKVSCTCNDGFREWNN